MSTLDKVTESIEYLGMLCIRNAPKYTEVSKNCVEHSGFVGLEPMIIFQSGADETLPIAVSRCSFLSWTAGYWTTLIKKFGE